MLNAKALFEAGRLAEAVQELNRELKSRPADNALRVFLFELLCFQGDLERAAKQLDVIAAQSGDAGTELAVHVYRGLLSAEAQRRSVFHGDGLPKFVTPPRAHVERYLLMLKKLGSAAPDEIGAMLEEAEEESPSLGGERQGQAFSSFRDADDRVASVLEVYHAGEYLWVPLDQITRLAIKPPEKLRELMWVQARLAIVGQPEGDVFIPTLYTDSHRHTDDKVKLGRLTEWEALHDRMVLGMGQRVFLVDDAEIALLDLGEVSFTLQPAGAPAV
jgi:type VI secretion system protein ImpE